MRGQVLMAELPYRLDAKHLPDGDNARRQCRQAAQVVIAFSRRVEIRTSGCRQPEGGCMRGEHCILPWLVAARDNFNRRAAPITKLSQKFAHFNSPERISAWMCNHRDTAAASNPAHGLTKACPLMRNETGLACAQIALERAVHVLDFALLDEKAGKMRAADHVSIGGEFADTRCAASNAQGI